MDHNRKQSDSTAILPRSGEYPDMPNYMRVSEYYGRGVDGIKYHPGKPWFSTHDKKIIANYIQEKKVTLRSLAEMVGHGYKATSERVRYLK